ncbi:MAG: aminopeptidase [Parcubacteria group bacterium]
MLRSFDNLFEMEDVPADLATMYARVYNLTMQERVDHKRWVLSRWPTPAMAQLAGMSLERFTDFYFRTVLFNYRRMAQAMRPLKDLMERTDRVRITGPGTDLSFSIKGMSAVPCDGKRNIPDGELYTAPGRDSVNGPITFNTVTVTKDGQRFGGVAFEFMEGRIVKATCASGDQDRMNKMLDTDEGARYVGEFSFGLNPSIPDTMGETLFDEKVDGSIHLTPGRSYADADNGNKSAIHWDIVLVQRPERGGGEIYFDGKLVRKDGLFVPKALRGLNPDALMN